MAQHLQHAHTTGGEIGTMQRLLDYLAADYARSRIENVTLLLVPAMLAVVGFAVAVAP